MKKSFFLLFAFLLCVSSTQAQTIRYVKQTSTGTGNGSSWANASADLQAVINASAANDEVWVAAGSYTPTQDPFGSTSPTDPRDKTFYVKDGIKIYGGFAGTETAVSQRNIAANTTTLSGDIGTVGDNTDNAYHVVLAVGTTGVTIDGFTVTGGNANVNNQLNFYGFGISRDNGGGIFTNGGTNMITNNTVYNNTVYYGAGIFAVNGINTLTNNTVYSNTATYGGGVTLYFATNTLTNNTVYSNTATNGGGILINGGTSMLTNNTVYSNAAFKGGGIFTSGSTNTLKNNIFWGNQKGASTTTPGADYYVDLSSSNTFINNLLQLASSNYPIDASLPYGIGTGASGNLFAQDPLFVNAADPNGADNIHRTADDGLTLQSSSPCINAGITGAGIPTTDITGATRVGNPDLGAYEACSLPTVYTVTGGGCSGVAVGLSNSQSGINYQLLRDGSNVGSMVAGTGASISFGNQTLAGVYTVLATNTIGGCSTNMQGSAVVLVVSALTATATPTAPLRCGANGTIVVSNVNGFTNLTSHTFSNAIAAPWSVTGVAALNNNELQLTPASNSQNGALIFTPTGTRPHTWTVAFDLNAYDANATDVADGMSFNYGDMAASPTGHEDGILNGNGLVVRFKEYQTQRVEVVYNGTVLQTYSADIHYPDIRRVRIAVDNNAMLWLSMGSQVVVAGLQLPAAYTTDNKSAWNFGWGARTGGATNRHAIDNISIDNSNNIGFSTDGTTFRPLPFFATAAGSYTIYVGNAACNSNIGSVVIPSLVPASPQIAQTICGNNRTITVTPPSISSQRVVWSNFATRPTLTNTGNLGDASVGSGYLQLTSNGNGQNGRVVFPAVGSSGVFTATYSTYIQDGGGADGYSFNYGIINNESGGESGMTNQGLSVCFFTFGTARMEVKINGTTVSTTNTSLIRSASSGGASRNVSISVTNNYLLTVAIDGSNLVTSFDLKTAGSGAYFAADKSTWQYAFGARTGGVNDNHRIDNLNITGQTGLRYSIDGGTTWQTSNAFATTNTSSLTVQVQAEGCTASTTAPTPTPITRKYVDGSLSTGNNDGSTWANAFQSLSTALQAACSGDSIWVKAGTYKPTQDPFGSTSPANPRDKTFYIKDGIKIYGGFAGTETAVSQRNIAANSTILSGDIGTVGVNTDNAYHVVLASAPSSGGIGVTIDGFSITGGNTNGSSSFVTVNGNSISSNIGGGICTINGSNTLTNNTVYGNTAADGGGVYTAGGTNTINNNTVNSNTAASGGGFYTYNGTNTISNNTLYNNTSSSYGGAIYTTGGTNTLRNNTVYSNSAYMAGGGIYTSSGTNTLTNNTVYNNTATYTFGGGIVTSNGTNTLSNNIFWANHATVAGADYYAENTNGNTFKNNLMQLASSNYTTTGTGSYDLGTGASGNIFAQNPLFVNAADPDGVDNIHRTADDGLALQNGSPAKNTGATGAGIPTTDITGATRDASPDMGAYEFIFPCPSSTILYVDASISASGNGTAWATAYKTLSEALTVAHLCSNITTINVATGTYYPTKKPYDNGVEQITAIDNRGVTFHIRDGLAIYGGYPAGGGTRNIAVNITTLSGDIGTVGVNTDNAYHVVLTSGSTGVTIDGFSVTGGNANGSVALSINGNNIYSIFGGGIYTNGGTNILTNNTVYSNSANNNGGGISAIGGTNTLTNNTLYSNSASNGGGIYATNGTNTLTNNILYSNTAGLGGGILTNLGSNTLTNNTVYSNTATYGGGIYADGGTNVLTNNTVYNNTGTYGGGIYTTYGTNMLTNNTIYGNTANTPYGGGMLTYSGTNTISNNIFWGNMHSGSSTVQGSDYYVYGTNGNTFTNNLLQLAASNYPIDASTNYGLGTGASGNIFAQDPLFVNAADPDGVDNIHRTADDGLALQSGSPCVNAGITGAGIPTTDITGATRVGNPDMGAYEIIPQTSLTVSLVSPPAFYCAGSTINASYTSTLLTFNSGNTFTLQLSNALGSFSNPTILATVTSVAANGTIVGTIPFSQAIGTGYRVRVVSSNTAFTGVNNGSNFEIKVSAATAAISVSGGIVANPSATGGTNPLITGCQGTNVVLTANVTNTSTYSWNKNGVQVGATNASTYTHNVGWGDYELIAYDINGCGIAADTVGVSLKPTSVAQGGLDRDICQGTATTIGATAQTATTYTWTATNPSDLAHLSSTTSANPTVLATLPASTTYNLQINKSYTVLAANFTCASALDPVNITLKSQPTSPTIVASATEVCQGSTITLTANNVVNSVKWFVDNVGSGTATPLVLSNTSGVSKTYTAKNLDANGCYSLASNAIPVIIQNAPTPTITSSVGTDISNVIKVCLGITNATLTANTSTGMPSYQWFSTNSATNVLSSTNGLALTNISTTSKSYYVKATYTYPNLSCVKQSVTKSIKQDATATGCRLMNDTKIVENSVSVYPNPTTDVLTIQIQSAEAQEGTLSLVNSLGQTVWSEKQNFHQGITDIQLPLTQLSVGIYHLIVDKSDWHQTLKVVKE